MAVTLSVGSGQIAATPGAVGVVRTRASRVLLISSSERPRVSKPGSTKAERTDEGAMIDLEGDDRANQSARGYFSRLSRTSCNVGRCAPFTNTLMSHAPNPDTEWGRLAITAVPSPQYCQ